MTASYGGRHFRDSHPFRVGLQIEFLHDASDVPGSTWPQCQQMVPLHSPAVRSASLIHVWGLILSPVHPHTLTAKVHQTLPIWVSHSKGLTLSGRVNWLVASLKPWCLPRHYLAWASYIRRSRGAAYSADIYSSPLFPPIRTLIGTMLLLVMWRLAINAEWAVAMVTDLSTTSFNSIRCLSWNCSESRVVNIMQHSIAKHIAMYL